MHNQPRSIAIVLDGNRRFARRLGLASWKGHEFGLQKLENLFGWCIELGIKELTLYCFSTENFKRSKQEIKYLFALFWQKFKEMANGYGLFAGKVRVNFIGRMEMFDYKMQKAMTDAMDKTKNNNALAVNFAMGYGARQEITDAARKIARMAMQGKIKPEDIDENLVEQNLYLKSSPDFIIRPGAEKRLSNFLLWQSSYSELFFIDKLWPEFTKEDLKACIDQFKKRKRRFGG